MRFLTAVALTLLTVGVILTPTATANPIVGQLYDGYFTYGADNYFHYGDSSYTRYWVSNPGYYSYGVYYPGSGYWKYTRVYVPTFSAASAPVYPPAYGPGWMTEAIKAGVAITDKELYFKTLNALGFRGQSYPFQSGGFYYGGGYGNVALSSAGYNGNTGYGYGVANVTAQYGALDVNRTLAQAFKLGQGAQEYARESTGALNGITESATSGMQRVAETLAKGQAAGQALKAAEAPASSISTTTVTGSATANSGGVAAAVTAGGSTPTGGEMSQAEFIASVVTPACGGCHSGADPKAKFDIVKAWPSLAPEQKDVVLERLFTRDPDKHMPRTADGKSGRLTADQLRQFVTH